MRKIEKDIAENDFKRFVEALRLSDLKLSKLEGDIPDIIELIEYGYLAIDEEGNAVLKLDQPTANLEEIKFKNRRLSVAEIEKYSQGKTDMEKARRLQSAVCGVNSAILAQLDADDYINISKVSAFFLPR